MRKLGVVLVLASLAAAAVVWPTAAFAETAYRTTLSETFATFDAAVWRARFNTFIPVEDTLLPSTGSATAHDGYADLAPDGYRGMSYLQTRAAVVTTLPAHVTYRVRYPGTGYREAGVMLSRNDIGDGAGNTGYPYVWQLLGMTDHYWAYNPLLSVVDEAGTGRTSMQPMPAVIVPSDVWLSGELWVYPDRAESSFNGVSLTTVQDMRPLLGSGGLRLLLYTADDYTRAGFEVDEVRVEEASPTVSPPNPPAKPRAGRGRGHQYAYGRGKGRGNGYGWRGR